MTILTKDKIQKEEQSNTIKSDKLSYEEMLIIGKTVHQIKMNRTEKAIQEITKIGR